MLNCLQALYAHPFDTGTDFFEPTRLEVTSIDVGNKASNIIPHKSEAQFGIRLNSLQKPEELCKVVTSICEKTAGQHDLGLTIHGGAFLTTDQDKIHLIQNAVQAICDE
jgi:succinyl-diaminopimelate desuccinylase